MSEKAHALGIREKDLKRALMLIRHLRATAYSDGIDPRATRIAILFALKCDTHFARQKISEAEMKTLEEIAEEFFQQTGR